MCRGHSTGRHKESAAHAMFIQPDDLARYRAYACAPDLEQFHVRDAEDLSRFFWGGDEGIVPRKYLSGIDNFRFLASELLGR